MKREKVDPVLHIVPCVLISKEGYLCEDLDNIAVLGNQGEYFKNVLHPLLPVFSVVGLQVLLVALGVEHGPYSLVDIGREFEDLKHILRQFPDPFTRFPLQAPSGFCNFLPDSSRIDAGSLLKLFREQFDALLSNAADRNVSHPGEGYAVSGVDGETKHRKDILDFKPFIECKPPYDPVRNALFKEFLLYCPAERIHPVKDCHLTIPVALVSQPLNAV